jgi:hypothetical protein
VWLQDQHGNRDVPLRFRHRASDEIMERLGLPAPKNRNRAAARASIIGELLLAHPEDCAVSFSRRKPYYTRRRRYYGSCATYANVIAEVSLLVEAGFAIEQRARSGSRCHQSTIRASATLMEAIPAFTESDFSFHLNEILVLRNELPNGRRETLDYRETRETVTMRTQLSRINFDYAALKLTLPRAQKIGAHWILEGRVIRTMPLFYAGYSIGAGGIAVEELTLFGSNFQSRLGLSYWWMATPFASPIIPPSIPT